MKKITLLAVFLMAVYAGYAQCEPVSSFNQGFETTDDAAIPACWSTIIGGPGVAPTANIETVSFNGTGQSKSVRISHDLSGENAHVILVSPKVSNLSAGTHRLRFSTFSNEDLFIEVGTLDGLTVDANFNMVGEPVQIQTGVHEYTVDFTSYTESDDLIGIRVTTGYTVFLDDIIWEVAPLCPDVHGISIVSTETTTASLAWNAGEEEKWDIVYGSLDVTDPQTLTPIAPAPTGTPEGTISDLLPGTAYKVWVRSVCGEDNGIWMEPITFTTDCLPVTEFNEDFDASASGTLPACWSSIIRGSMVTPENENVMVKDWNAVSGQNSVALSRSVESSEVFLVAPSVSTLPLGTHRIKFYAFSYSESAILQMGTLTSNNNDAAFTQVEAVGLTSSYEEYVVDFTVYDGSDIYVAFKMGAGSTIFIDNIRWEIAPECADVSEIITTATTPNSASFLWAAGGGETTWDMVYGDMSVTDPAALTPVSPAPSGYSMGTISGLEDNTSYKLWVRSSCGAEAKGAWIGPLVFRTACLPIASFNEDFDAGATGALPECWSSIVRGEDTPDFANVEVVDFAFYSGPHAVRIQSIPLNAQSESDVILVSPNLSTLQAGTYRLKFYVSSSEAAILEVGTLNSGSVGAEFSPFQDVDVTSVLTEQTVDFAEYGGTDTYIGIRHKTGHDIYVDHIRWELTPLCADVQEIAIADTGTSTATVTWIEGGSEANWQVAYGLANETDPETVTQSGLLSSTNITLTELADNTAYKVWVRSSCGIPDGNGAWIGPVEFTTACLPVNVPYIEDFESTDGPELPACTLNINAGQGSDWRVANNALTYRYDSDHAANAWFFTPGINLVAGTDYTISYSYGNNSNNVEKLNVFFGSTKDVEGMTIELGDHPEITDEAEETHTETFGVNSTGIYYFGFHAYSDADQNRLFVDDINIAPTLKNDDFVTEDFKFSPNPVKDILNLSYKQDITDVVIYNLLGQKVFENTINASTAKVDMSGLVSGNYLVKITSENHTSTIKILKQ